MSKLFCGIDFGGTSIKGALIDLSGNILKKSSVLTESEKGEDFVILNIVKLIKDLILGFESEVLGIGLGIPGLIDSEKGVVVVSGNIAWKNVEIVKKLKEHFSYPIKIANDANVAALGEATFGSGKNYKTSVFFTLGTGVGGGIIIDGKIYAGNMSAGAELGHMITHPNGEYCTCGNYGCLEAYASATALIKQTKKAMQENKNSKMWQIGDISKVDGKTAFDYAKIDETAKNVVENYIFELSIGLINVANIFRPEAIILGGGIALSGDDLIVPLRKLLKEGIYAKDFGPEVKLVQASLKDAGIIGAAVLCMKN